ncbi:MAG: response regulator [Desulfobulbaceae bacterium]|nr:response regulator [Desulfobulbaceae bacterium]HIJ79033.1 response regulator [Deltaproteobacteria bacterium]
MTKENVAILLVDDVAVVRSIMKLQLQQMGFADINEAPDGSIAMNVLQSKRIDLIISDWNMPVMSGYELLKEVRGSTEFRDIPFIMVTAEASASRINMALQLKVNELILKPFTLEILENKIAQVIQ